MVKLGVNIDHVATLRQARRGLEPDVLEAGRIVEKSGAHGLTVHLREDRRHIQDNDVYLLKKEISLPLNMEMACNEDVILKALDIKPYMCTIVPEKREEVTTEGGLDVCGQYDLVEETVRRLKDKGMKVSLFIEAEKEYIDCSKKMGVDFIEIHTGRYANSFGENKKIELKKIEEVSKYALSIGLTVNAGHGLNYENTRDMAMLGLFNEFNIGHSIISRSIFTGLEKAVKDMLLIVK